MGDPRRRFPNKYVSLEHPWRRDRLEREYILVGEYGLKNKKEIWRLKYIIKKYRRMMRELRSTHDEERKKEIMGYLKNAVGKYGLLGPDDPIDKVLDLTEEDLLKRRLQTLVYMKGLARTIHQARQFIVHGHVRVAGRRVRSPGYLVPVELEDKITVDEKVKPLIEGVTSPTSIGTERIMSLLESRERRWRRY